MNNLDGLEASLERTVEDLRGYKSLIEQVMELKNEAERWTAPYDGIGYCDCCNRYYETEGHKDNCLANAILKVKL